MTNILKFLKVPAILLVSSAFLVAPLELNAFSGGPGTGGLGDRTDSPLSSSTCTQCHSGGNFGTVTAEISVADINGPVTVFVANETYTITVVAQNTAGIPGGYGFQATVLDSANAGIGTLSNPSNGTQFVTINGRNYWEHQGASATNTFTVEWTAPAAMTTTVTIYAIVNVVNANGGTSGDVPSPGNTFSASLPVELMNFSID